MLKKIFKFRESQTAGTGEKEMPFLDHLEDLRWTVIRMLVTLAIAMTLSFIYRVELMEIIQRPLHAVSAEIPKQLQALGVADSITISFKLAFYAGIVLSFPLLLFFVAQFVLPGLTAVEKKYLYPALAVGTGLFLSGVFFCYFLVLPITLDFLYSDAQKMGFNPQWTIEKYVSFVTQFTVSFGLTFEMPVVVLFLVKVGLLSSALMQKTRAYAVLIIFVVAAIITPTTDVLSLMCLALPMLVLYEISIWLAKYVEAKAARAENRDENDRNQDRDDDPEEDPEGDPVGDPEEDPEDDPEEDRDGRADERMDEIDETETR